MMKITSRDFEVQDDAVSESRFKENDLLKSESYMLSAWDNPVMSVQLLRFEVSFPYS